MTELLLHQKEAVDKLKQYKIGALYMEMGTGKTLTALELIRLRLEADKVDNVLWLCPCSVKSTIKHEIQKHSDLIDKVAIKGIESISGSTNLYLKLMNFAQNNRFFLVVDESNLVKNPTAKRTIRIGQLAKYAKYKLILNGTPMSRNIGDLYAQWKILDWRIFGYKSYYTFESQHIVYDDKRPGLVKKVLREDEIISKIEPYTYQKKKSECVDLPEKTYSREYLKLTQEQRIHYLEVKEVFLQQIDEIVPETIYRLFTAVQHVARGMRITSNSMQKMKIEQFFENPEKDNPRLETLFNILHRTSGKKIIWCRYTDEILLITKMINEEFGEGSAVMVYGDMNQKERDESLEKFENEADYFVANKMCAGYGLNLQFCDYMIYYNNDWDLATRLQSEDRVHRIGQKNNVHIVDILASDTIDQIILDCLQGKESMLESFKRELRSVKNGKKIS